MADLAISQDHSATGEWCIPGGAQVAGSMKWSAKRVSLELSDSLSTPGDIAAVIAGQDTAEHYPVIHGVADTGQRVTVLDAYLSTWKANLFAPIGKKVPGQVMGHTAAFGAHITEATKYTEMRFVGMRPANPS